MKRQQHRGATPQSTGDYILRIVDKHGGVSLRALRLACGHRRDFTKELTRLKRAAKLVTWREKRPNRSGPKPMMVGRRAP